MQPRRALSRDVYIGDYVFATPDKRVAAMYLAPKSGGTILINTFDGEPYAIINNNVETFKKVDKGGSIYTVPAESFKPTIQEGLEETERISKVPVRPIGSQDYPTSLEAMSGMGVHVYFVDNQTFDRIMSAKDHGLSIIRTLHPYAV